MGALHSCSRTSIWALDTIVLHTCTVGAKKSLRSVTYVGLGQTLRIYATSTPHVRPLQAANRAVAV